MMLGTAVMGGNGLANVLNLKASAAMIGSLYYEIKNDEVTITGCPDYTSGELVIPDTIEGFPVTTIGDYAFDGCNYLTNITIPDSVTTIGYSSFGFCFELTSITIPNSVKTIGGYAFQSCKGLTSITIPASVTSIDKNAFDVNPGALESITVSDGNKVYHSSGNCIIETESKKLIAGCKNSVIPADGSVTSIDDYAFHDCNHGLTNITIPDCVTSIGQAAFGNCRDLTNITIPDGVTSIGPGAFASCKGLTSITIPDSVMSIGHSAFSNCTGLTRITIPDSVTSIEYSLFSGCTGLKNITIPDNITNIGFDAFKDTAFYNNESNWTNEVLYINNYLIRAKTSLSGYCKIKAGVKLIAEYAFYQCSGLTSIAIPKSVTTIEGFAFGFCDGLKDVYYSGSEADRNKITIVWGNGYNKVLTNATWHYNADSYIPKVAIIKGNSSNSKKTYDYKTTVTYTANVPEGGSVQWYVDGKPAGADKTLTVKEMKSDYIVKVIVTDKNGNQTKDEENVTIKNGFFDKFIWFFKHLFNPGAYNIKQ